MKILKKPNSREDNNKGMRNQIYAKISLWLNAEKWSVEFYTNFSRCAG